MQPLKTPEYIRPAEIKQLQMRYRNAGIEAAYNGCVYAKPHYLICYNTCYNATLNVCCTIANVIVQPEMGVPP